MELNTRVVIQKSKKLKQNNNGKKYKFFSKNVVLCRRNVCV